MYTVRPVIRVRILPYVQGPAEFWPYDPAVGEVVQVLRDEIQRAKPALEVEHIGSTSVPDCGGKGVVDLAVLYREDSVAIARTVLDELGFQKQGGPEPWPENRPMRVGCVEHNGRPYQIHAHVMALNCDEHRELVWFRDLLRRDPLMRQHYEAWKRAILAMEIDNPLEYCKAKGTFIETTLKQRASTEEN
jgi:GrpB-like predicted nucleotidyltransferase (UPF0157 family)